MASVVRPLARRPLVGCVFQTATRQIARRSLSSEVASSSSSSSTPASPKEPSRYHVIPTKAGGVRTAFAVYDPPAKPSSQIAQLSSQKPKKAPLPPPEPVITPSGKIASVDVMRAYDQQQIAIRDPTGARTLLFSRKNPDSVRPGDVLQVTLSSASKESFAGVCLGIRRSGIETAVLLRGQASKTGVEMWFKIYSKSVGQIDVIQRKGPRRARRAKLHYMRKPEHDRGSVDDLVREWRKSRNVMRTRGGSKTTAKK